MKKVCLTRIWKECSPQIAPLMMMMIPQPEEAHRQTTAEKEESEWIENNRSRQSHLQTRTKNGSFRRNGILQR